MGRKTTQWHVCDVTSHGSDPQPTHIAWAGGSSQGEDLEKVFFSPPDDADDDDDEDYGLAAWLDANIWCYRFLNSDFVKAVRRVIESRMMRGREVGNYNNGSPIRGRDNIG